VECIIFFLIVVIGLAMEMNAAIARKGQYFLIKMKIMILKNIENEAKAVSSRGV
jgi:hypothetical protein